MNAKEVLAYAKKNNVVMVDLRFTDWPGTWQHCSFPIREIDESTFEDGLGFDGSSIRGWQAINESDMLMVPDPASGFIDPFFAHPTLVLICDIQDPITRESYSRDPRFIAKKAEAYLQSTGIGDTAFFGPEAEFFIFNSARFSTASHEGFYHLDSIEGKWNSGAVEGGANLAYKPRHKEGYFPVPPTDSQQDIRSEMVLEMEKLGIHIEAHHHEVATAGQAEIDMRFDTLVKMADQLLIYKYVVKSVARRNGVTATFMPKPLFEDNGTGMHVHQSIWKDGNPLMAGDGYAGFSELGLHYIGGILKHSRAIAAFSNPTTNSYKRLVPGFEAPVNLAYSSRNRSAACRIPMYSPSPKAKRIEVRYPDSTRTSTGCPPRRLRPFPPCRPASTRRSSRWRQITTSSSKATSSRGTRSKPGSSTNGRTRSTRFVCARTRTSSSCTSTSRRKFPVKRPRFPWTQI